MRNYGYSFPELLLWSGVMGLVLLLLLNLGLSIGSQYRGNERNLKAQQVLLVFQAVEREVLRSSASVEPNGMRFDLATFTSENGRIYCEDRDGKRSIASGELLASIEEQVLTVTIKQAGRELERKFHLNRFGVSYEE